MTSKVFLEDIEYIASSDEIRWTDMRNSAVLITGATGLIGYALVHALSAANDKHKLNLRIIAHGRNAEKGEALVRECGIRFISGDIREPMLSDELPETIDYIVHGAAVTKSADMVANPVGVMTTAFDGTRNILEQAKERHCKSLVYLSSMEVYGQTELKEVAESDLGYLDLSNIRSSYPESKRLCENMCAAYAAQYGVPAKVARLAQTFGAGTSRSDTRVFAQFARNAIANQDIELHTEGKSRGNYCYTADTIRALLLIMLDGKYGEAYNVANHGASTTIREMAELVADDVCGGTIKVVVSIPEDIHKRGYAPVVSHSLNTDKLKALGWIPRYGLADMYRRIIVDWKEGIL